MLESLYIRNFALVSELQLDFSEGLTIITGETGSGKSLIIGAIQLLMGGRASALSLRKGEKNCEISGVFRLEDAFANLQKKLDAKLEEAGIPPCEEHQLLLKRTLFEKGSRAFINGSAVTIAILKEIGTLLVDIHGPHDNQTLLQTHRQLELLDSYAENAPLLKQCREEWCELKSIQNEICKINEDHLNAEEVALLEHQFQEIRKAGVSPDEEQQVLERHKIVSSAKTLMELSQQCAGTLSNHEGSIVDQLADLMRPARDIADIDSDTGQPLLERLENLSEIISELGEDYERYTQDLELDPEEMQKLEDRLGEIQKLKRKYGPTIDDVLQTAARIADRLKRINSRDDVLAQWKKREKEYQTKVQETAQELTKRRTEACKPLSEKINKKLRVLGFSKAVFEVDCKKAELGPEGCNHIEFMFAPNVGEDLQPLRQIGSSGEIARVMLAIKTVLTSVDDVPVLIFDEIDANIGGRVAGEVGKELVAVAKSHQVFSITHLPRIAAVGKQHLQVEKWVENGRTFTRMKQLQKEERVEELIRMLGADANSETARKHALEMLALTF
ncbi:MAG: DNA repair protein RecN [Lentisphaeria bacterium]